MKTIMKDSELGTIQIEMGKLVVTHMEKSYHKKYKNADEHETDSESDVTEEESSNDLGLMTLNT